MHQEEDENIERPENPHEFTSESIREGRRQYFKTALQPWRQHTASKEFIETYPEESKEMFTQKEIKHAKEVWNDLPGSKNWRDSR